MDSDDVAGIRRLTDSAHIGGIKEGPYRGLSSDISAIDAATLVHEQLHNFSIIQRPGETEARFAKLENSLTARRMDSLGIKESIGQISQKLEQSKKVFDLHVSGVKEGCERSVLTDNESLKLYSSFFDPHTKLSKIDHAFVCGESKTEDKSNELPKLEKATRKRECKLIDLPVVVNLRTGAKQDFEQINDDLYAKVDNKYIVFNGIGTVFWNGNIPVSKLSSIQDDFFVFNNTENEAN